MPDLKDEEESKEETKNESTSTDDDQPDPFFPKDEEGNFIGLVWF